MLQSLLIRPQTAGFCLLAAAVCNIAAAADELRILPAEITLTAPSLEQQILVEIFRNGQAEGPAPDSVQLTSDDPQIVRVEGRRLIPTGDGTTFIRIPDAPNAAPTRVTISGMQVPGGWSFRRHVEPVLARQGCSSGACHGALAGKGGFRLSLRGYDPERDFFSIVQQQQGRRVELLDPASSLLLTKPTMTVPHRGGLRLQSDSSGYRILAEWIAEGAPGPVADEPSLQKLEVLPERVILRKGQRQPLIVMAHYADGRIEDVTQFARFSSATEAVAGVDENGVVQVAGSGEGAVTAWFSSRIVIAGITVPFENSIPSELYAAAPQRNLIDQHVLQQLQRLNLAPSPRCSDEVFIRRAFLDTIGTLPTADEVRSFLSSTEPTKRDQLIESLLQRPEFVDYWTYRWSDLLLLNGTELRPEAIQAWYKWIHDRVAANMPWDQFVREIVTAKGSSLENGATNFFARHQAPEDMAENVSQAFLGLSIGCARCHNHPLEKWTNDQYYAFANLFARVRAKGWGGDSRSGDGKRTVVNASFGELVQPRTGKPQRPAPLDAAPLEFDAPGDRREYLATWLTSPDNTLFARSITNRVWKNFFGTGLVEQVDDMRGSNPAVNEQLLAAAADHLVKNHYDLKSLMRLILQSEAWQRSSQTLPENAGDQRQYSRYFPRRLPAEVLLDAVSQVTDVPTEFNQILYPGNDRKPTTAYPRGTRAIQLSDSAVESWFLQTFGRNQRRITCECERSDEPSLVQVLHLSNGDTVNQKLATPDNRLGRWLKDLPDDSALLNEVFLVCLARFPSAEESGEILPLLKEATPEQKREVLEDLVWSIVGSREFLFNH
ncbi:MAG: hypothetical protein RLZZ436_1434 [Planctomycetota bacterium]|jgi:hypothetical protein